MTIKIERVVVTGGRKFTDSARIEADLRALLPFGLQRVAQGGNGIDEQFGDAEWPREPWSADALAWLATSALRLEAATHRPNRNLDGTWRLDQPDGTGKGQFPRRNVRMLEAERPDLVLAYPDPNSRGTWHCVREACKRGITTIVWAPFVEVYDFMGEDGIKPGIYIDGPKGNIIRIDDQRRESHGRASDGGWASLTLIEGACVPSSSRFGICVFDKEKATEQLVHLLGDEEAAR